MLKSCGYRSEKALQTKNLILSEFKSLLLKFYLKWQKYSLQLVINTFNFSDKYTNNLIKRLYVNKPWRRWASKKQFCPDKDCSIYKLWKSFRVCFLWPTKLMCPFHFYTNCTNYIALLAVLVMTQKCQT